MCKTSPPPAIYRKNLQRTAGLFLLFALLCSLFYIPCYFYIRNLNQTTSLEYHQYNLESNMAMLDASMEAILNAESTLNSSGISLPSILNQKEPDDTKLLSIRKCLSSYFSPYTFISNVGIVINDEPVLDRYMIFYSFYPLDYRNHLYTSDENYWASLTERYQTIPVTPVYSSILKNYDAVTVACRLSRKNDAYLFVHYSADGLYDLFFNKDMSEYCRLNIYYGDMLLASNRDALTESYKQLEITGTSPIALRAELQIPDSYLARDLQPLARLAFGFSITLILSFLLWIILFAAITNRPFNKATRALLSSGHINNDWTNMNTDEFLTSAIHQLNSKITDYHQIIEHQRQRSRTQLLERALYRGLYSEDARQRFAESFPDFPAQWQLALVQYMTQTEKIESNAILAALSQHFEEMPHQVYCLPFNHEAVIVLFPITPVCDPGMELQKLCSQYEEMYPISLSYHLGNIYEDPSLLAEAFQQIEHTSITLQVESHATARNQGGAINMNQLQTIYYALQSGDSKTACIILENGTAPFLATRDRVTAKYTYHALSYMLLQLELENRNLGDIPIPAFNNERFIQLFRKDFPRYFETICQRLLQDRANQAENLERDILDYIEQNFSNQQLSITAVTEHFHISAPTLQKRMNTAVGKTFSSYVEELRMHKARKALLTTDLTIQEISESIGYTNTNSFYKAYRRIFEESPRTTRQTSNHL